MTLKFNLEITRMIDHPELQDCGTDLNHTVHEDPPLKEGVPIRMDHSLEMARWED
jgi:hypothetical protein